MGWVNPDFDPECKHEGYLVGLVPAVDKDGSLSTWRYRELSAAGGDDPGRQDMPLKTVQVGCECGWRSSRITAPPTTVWVPFSVFAPQSFEDECRELWREHLELESARSGLASLRSKFPTLEDSLAGHQKLRMALTPSPIALAAERQRRRAEQR